jgi:hypothetical protein
MRDIVFVAITVVFFAIATAYVRACARIVGPDDLVAPEATKVDSPELNEPERGCELVHS